MKGLAGNGMVRDYFASETAFGPRKDFIEALFAAYDEAAEKSTRSARNAVSIGSMRYMREAQWDEAVAATIERVLCMFPRTSDEGDVAGDNKIVLPERPDFAS